MESNSDNSPSTSSSDSKKYDEADLWQKLIDYMSAKAAYTIKRLLPADLRNIYNHNPSQDLVEKLKINPFNEGYEIAINQEKGGVNVSENVVYNW